MTNSNKKTLKKRFSADEGELINILNGWNPIPGSPADEYDCVVHHVLGKIEQHTENITIEFIVKSIIQEVESHLGITPTAEELTALQNNVEAWQLSRFA